MFLVFLIGLYWYLIQLKSYKWLMVHFIRQYRPSTKTNKVQIVLKRQNLRKLNGIFLWRQAPSKMEMFKFLKHKEILHFLKVALWFWILNCFGFNSVWRCTKLTLKFFHQYIELDTKIRGTCLGLDFFKHWISKYFTLEF